MLHLGYTQSAFLDLALKDKTYQTLQTSVQQAEQEASSVFFHAQGLNEGGKLYLLAALSRHLDKSPCLLVEDFVRLRRMKEDWQSLFNKVFVWHRREEQGTYVLGMSHSRKEEQERIYIQAQLLQNKGLPLLVHAASLAQIQVPSSLLKEALYPLCFEKSLEIAFLEEILLARGYEKVSMVEQEGQYARRGDILDIFPVGLAYDLAYAVGLYQRGLGRSQEGEEAKSSEELTLPPAFYEKWKEEKTFMEQEAFCQRLALRLSFFDDEIDQVKLFDIQSQTSICNLAWEKYVLLPAREVFLPCTEEGRKQVEAAMWACLAREKEQAQRLEERAAKKILTFLQEQEGYLKENRELCAWEAFLPVLWKPELFLETEEIREEKNTLTKFDLDESQAEEIRVEEKDNRGNKEKREVAKEVAFSSCLFFVDELPALRPALDRIYSEYMQRTTQAILGGQLPRSAVYAMKNPIESLAKLFCQKVVLSLGLFPFSQQNFRQLGIEGSQLLTLKREAFHFGMKDLEHAKLEQIAEEILLLPKNSTCVLAEQGEKERQALLAHLQQCKAELCFPSFSLQNSFVYPEAKLFYVGSEQLQRKKKQALRSSRRRDKKDLLVLGDLQPGDYVVHDTHGIARYEGIFSLERNGVKRDYLKLSYAQEDQLFLPMEALPFIQKYLGAGTAKVPKLSRLGGGDWLKLKEKARHSTKQLATNLIKVYAERLVRKGFRFQGDSPWEREFAQSFPYEETPDQLRCIEEISRDMESDKMMDRLLCGDVGFGKTEVAFRALFKAISNQKQVALLSPTTVLTHQHYENLVERLKDYPVEIAELSRFVEVRQQNAILKKLKAGQIDVLVATHRAFSKDVQFKDLGLLIIDEEQRFGVDHKEQMKEKYPQVDVLSLSATPIPRTLHMSLAGIRDISILQDPPQDRRAIMTYVLPYDEEMLKEGIQRELERGGQVFYLFNDTHKIYAKAKELQERMPHLRLGVAHGKMSEQKLEEVIQAFLAQELDLLLCTTIIESGIDMPKVNTIIVEHADRLGLSQLYQIRGRVGRSYRQAYAYITFPAEKVLSEAAQKRLSAIRDFTDLGSGFKIAMRDLEVRGAGAILGAEQHGQMEAVGYDLYCRMLEEEIHLAKQKLLDDTRKQHEVEEKTGASFTSQGLLQTQTVLAEGSQAMQAKQGEQVHLGEEIKRGEEAKQGEGVEEDLALKAEEIFLDLRLDSYVPADFVPNEAERMDLYRKLSEMKNYEDYLACYDEILDRYGDLRKEVETLLQLSYIRSQMCRYQMKSLKREKMGFIFYFEEGKTLPMQALSKLWSDKRFASYLQLDVSKKPQLVCRKSFQHLGTMVKFLMDLFIYIEK